MPNLTGLLAGLSGLPQGIMEGEDFQRRQREAQILNALRQQQLQTQQQQQQINQATWPALLQGMKGLQQQPAPMAPMSPPPQQQPMLPPQLASFGGDAGMAFQPPATGDTDMVRQPAPTGDTDMVFGTGAGGRFNPGNIKAPGGGWAQFSSPQEGVAAIGSWLDRAQTNHGLTTIRQLLDDSRYGYAPSADPGNRGKNLPEAAAKIVGVDPDQPVDMRDPSMRQKMVQAILKQEGASGVDPGETHRRTSAWWSQAASPEDKAQTTVASRQFLTPQVLRMQGQLQLPQLVAGIEQSLPDASPEVKVGVLQNVFGLLHPLAKEQYAQTIEAMKFDIEESRRDETTAETKRHHRAIEGQYGQPPRQGYQILTEPESGEQYSMIPGQPKSAIDMQGRPYQPKGAQKIGGPGSDRAEGPFTDPETNKQFWNKKKGDPTTAIDIEGKPYKPSAVARLGAQGRWSDDAMEALVAQSMYGDPNVLQRIPRTGPARQQYEETLAKHLKAVEGGIEGGTATMMMNRLRMHEAQSAATTAGRVTMQTELWSQEANLAGNEVLRTSKGFSRTNFPTVNAALAAYNTQTGDPDVIRFGGAINALLNAYGKMSNPTGTGVHDADKERLAAILDKKMSEGQVADAVDQIKREGRINSTSAESAQREVLQRIMPGGAGTYPAQQPPPTGNEPGAPPPGATQYGPPGSYPTATSVYEAYDAGKITKTEAMKILKDQFGVKDAD